MDVVVCGDSVQRRGRRDVTAKPNVHLELPSSSLHRLLLQLDSMDNLRVARVDNVTLDALTPPPPDDPSGLPRKDRSKGTLHLTPHHLIYSPSTSPSDEVWIPYPSIILLTRLPQTFGGVYPLQIRTRTFESYVLGFDKAMEGGAEDVWLSVKDCAVAGEQPAERG
jgi:hypothetical protein